MNCLHSTIHSHLWKIWTSSHNFYLLDSKGLELSLSHYFYKNVTLIFMKILETVVYYEMVQFYQVRIRERRS